MKNHVWYHGNCPDGFGAAFAAWLRFQNTAEYVPVNYGKPMPKIEDGDRVMILDFSYPRVDLIALSNRTSELVVLDHHATAEKDLEGLPFCKFDMNKSGAVLACEYIHGDAIKCEVGQLGEFFAYLQDRDLWQFKLPQSREVSMAVRSYPFDFKVWSDISGLVVSGQIYEAPGICIDWLKKEGVVCRRLTEQQVENMANHHRWARFDQSSKKVVFLTTDQDQTGNPSQAWVAPVANATVFFSEVGEKLLEKRPEAYFSAYYMDREDGKRQWGLRSRNGFDCSVIAKAFGGGGHKQSAGFIEST